MFTSYNKFLLLFIFLSFSLSIKTQTVTITAPVASATYCAGSSVTVNYTVTSAFGAGNVFTMQLSDLSGSFASPVNIGSVTATGSGGVSCPIPFTTASGSLYRIRIITSAPTFTSQSNGVNLTVTGLALSTPTVVNSTFCQGETFNVNFTQNCNFSNVGFNNVYSVELSDGFGSFVSPVTIGTRTSTTAAAITCTIPASPAGSGYRVRIVSSNPVITSLDNGFNLTINPSFGNPSVFGNGFWNVYCFNNFNNYTNNYQGFYTENNLNFNSTTRWANTSSPSSANAASGSAYAGCVFGNTNYSVVYKRTNIPCGYYQIDIPLHDDYVYVIINGATVYSHIGCCDAHTNVWTGIIQPSDNVELRFTNGGGPGYLAANFNLISPVSLSPPVTICAGTSTSLTATNSSTLSLNYAWTPSASVSPPTGSMVVASPTITTTYTLDSSPTSFTGCTLFTNTVLVTVNPIPTTSITSISSSLICFGVSNAIITASGANTYSWSPAAGLNTTTGNVVIANPSVTTVYTVSGSNNCSVVNATTTVSVQTIPSAPSPTAFGNNVWNVYCYYTPNTYTSTTNISDYYGYYTENNLSFLSSNRWGTGSTPSSANGGTMGLAYQGCNIGVDYHSTISKRTNFTCGYYQIDVSYHDDGVTIFVDNLQVFQHIGCCDVHTNVWSGFLGPTSTVEIRQQEGAGGSGVGVNFTSIPFPVLSSPVTICAGTTTSLTASPFFSTASYNWSPVASLTVTSTGTLVPASPTITTNYTCTVTDAITSCSAAATVSVIVNPLPTTTVSPTTGTISCSFQSQTLTCGGANSYSWSPSAGLSATTGNSVIATPSVTTIYTVSGNNNCATIDATTTITVVPLVSPTVFPSGTWNAYCYNDIAFTNYYGYYTENGSGSTGYNFNTTTKWASGAAPSTANATNGLAYQGCPTSNNNISISFKRTGFTCNTYSINTPTHDDGISLFINGVLVGSHTSGCCDIHNNLWVGPLGPNSTVEFRLTQATSGSGMTTTFSVAPTTPSLSTWVGGTSTDWFTSSNWCGSGVPNSITDVLIPNSGPLFMPNINGVGAACRSLTISPSTPAITVSNALIAALPAASLTISGSNNLDVYGNWINNGVFTPNLSSINILGSSSTSISSTSSESFYNLIINKTGANTVTIPTGLHQIINDMSFTNGIINQNGTLRFLNGSSASGANDNSYVNGQVNKFGNQAFTFPVGDGLFYRPISIGAPALITDHFTAQYFLANPSPPYTNTSKDPSLHHIGSCEYWILNRTGGSSNVNVTLSWNSTSCGVTSLTNLLVARWDAGQVMWKDEGNGGTTGNTAAGTVVTAAPVTLFSPFTLASETSANPLPIQLGSFSCNNVTLNTNKLSWYTLSEFNNDYFSIERSLDGINFSTIGKQKSLGNNNGRFDYSYIDQNALNGFSYYRLKQVDYDGKYTFSDICSAENKNSNINFYPNPVKNELIIDFNDEPKSNEISISDVSGKLLALRSTYINSKIIIDCSGLAEGIYFLKIIIGNKEIVNKFNVTGF